MANDGRDDLTTASGVNLLLRDPLLRLNNFGAGILMVQVPMLLNLLASLLFTLQCRSAHLPI